jgi:hypothetical protein
MDRTPREHRLAAEIAARASGCPGADDLQRFHEGSLTGTDRDAVAAHVEGCHPCSEALEFLEWEQAEATQPEADVPRDVERRVDALIDGASGPPRASRARFLWSGALRIAAGVALVGALSVLGYQWLDRRAVDEDLGELRGDTPLELVHPVARIDTPPDAMRWVAHPQALTYRIILLDENLEEVWVRKTEDSTPALAPDAEAIAALAPGGRYTWQVEALDAVGAVIDRSAAAHFEIAGEPAR